MPIREIFGWALTFFRCRCIIFENANVKIYGRIFMRKAIKEIFCEILSHLRLIGICGGTFMIFYRICELCYCFYIYPTHKIRQGVALMLIFCEIAIWFLSIFACGTLLARPINKKKPWTALSQLIIHIAFLTAIYILCDYILFVPFYIVFGIYAAISIAFMIYNEILRRKKKIQDKSVKENQG